MKLIMENWRGYQKREEILSSHEYITEVLGVKISLTEAYPYSPSLTEEIYREQQLLEQWWFGNSSLTEGPLGDWWSDAKEKIASYPETIKMLYRAITGEGLHTYTKAITRRGMAVKNKIIEFIDFIIEKASNFEPLQVLVEWAQKVKEAIAASLKWIDDITKPWMKALGLTALSVGLQYAWSRISDYAEEFFKSTESGAFIEKAKEFLKDKIKDLFGDTLAKIRDTGASMLSGGVTTFWDWMKKIANGAGFVVDALEPVLSFFKNRGGLSESTTLLPTSKVGRVIYDPYEGLGETPNGTEVDYRGFTVWMTPQNFIKLNPDRGEESEFLAQHFQQEGDVVIAPCWISARYADGIWQVNGHEGRGRAMEVNKIQPSELMPVHVFPGEGNRARNLTREMVLSPIQSEVSSFQVKPSTAVLEGEIIE